MVLCTHIIFPVRGCSTEQQVNITHSHFKNWQYFISEDVLDPKDGCVITSFLRAVATELNPPAISRGHESCLSLTAHDF